MINQKILTKIIKWGVYLTPLSILLYKHATVHPFVTIKSLVFFVFVEALFALWVGLIFFYPQYRFKPKLPEILLFSFLGSIIVSALLGVNIGRSFWSTPDRMMGVFAILHFFGFFLILRSIFLTKKEWKKYLYYLVGLSGVVSILAVVEKIYPNLFLVSFSSRLGSTLGNPAFLATYLLFNILLIIWLIYEDHKENRTCLWFLVPVGILNVIILAMANTRGTILGFLASILVLLAFFAWNRRKGSLSKNIPLITIILLIIFGSIFIGTKSADFWQKIPGIDRVASISLKDGAVGNRLAAWGIALDVFKERPILGWGFENFRYGFNFRYDPGLFQGGFSETHWDKPHNIFLEYLVTGGLVGILTYLAFLIGLFYFVLKKADRSFKPFGIAILVGYLVQSSFIFDTFGSYLMLFIFLAFVFRVINLEQKESKAVNTGILKIAGVVIVGLAVVWLIFLNGKMYMANVKQYHGLNFYINGLPGKAVESYKDALAIRQPYQNEVRDSFLSATKQMAHQLEIPDIDNVIRLAIQEFEKVIAADPNNYFRHATLADARVVFATINPEFFEGAEESLNRAIELSSKRQQNLFIKGKILLGKGDQDGAIDAMEEAIALEPDVGASHFFYGILLLQIGYVEDGLEQIEIAESLGRYPKTNQERAVVANHYGDAGDYEKAAGLYRGVVKEDPGDMEAKLKLAIILMYINYTGEAKPLFEEVLRRVPEFKDNPNFELIRPFLDDLGIEY